MPVPDVARFPRVILAACCLPWTPSFELDEPVFRDSLRWQVARDLRHLYLFGTAGEGYAVSESQFDQIVAVFDEELRGAAVEPMVGLISMSLPTIQGRIERCLDRGIRDFQISFPNWGTLTDPEVELFFAETCGRFPEARFLHYNLARSGRLLTAADYAVLADRHPNLVATKNSAASNAEIAGLVQKAPQLRHFLTEGGFGFGGLLGQPGFLVSTASISPVTTHEYFQAATDGDNATVSRLAREFAGVGDDLVRLVGPGRIDGAYDKVFCRLHDPRFPLRLLPPYSGATDAAFEAFREALHRKHPQWLAT